jgi:hypothetical protein
MLDYSQLLQPPSFEMPLEPPRNAKVDDFQPKVQDEQPQGLSQVYQQEWILVCIF